MRAFCSASSAAFSSSSSFVCCSSSCCCWSSSSDAFSERACSSSSWFVRSSSSRCDCSSSDWLCSSRVSPCDCCSSSSVRIVATIVFSTTPSVSEQLLEEREVRSEYVVNDAISITAITWSSKSDGEDDDVDRRGLAEPGARS